VHALLLLSSRGSARRDAVLLRSGRSLARGAAAKRCTGSKNGWRADGLLGALSIMELGLGNSNSVCTVCCAHSPTEIRSAA
jgi:hypothetical protein